MSIINRKPAFVRYQNRIPTPQTAENNDVNPIFTILIDNDCPLCKKEGKFMAWLDGGKNNLALVDIAAPDFDASTYGTTFEAVMGEIHGVTRDGTLITGMEVFRRAYAAVGWGWLFAPTAWPVLRPICDAAYRFFAKHRLAFTGRKDACTTDRCKIPGSTA